MQPHVTATGTCVHGLRPSGYLPAMSFQVTEVQKVLEGADALCGPREVEGPDGVMNELKADLGGSA